MKTRGMFKVLSGVALIGLMLGIIVPKAIGSSYVYWVKPTSASNSGTANAVWQTFVATCDSIDSVTFFVGAEATDTTANYLVSITDSATSQEVWSNSRSAKGWKYQDMGFGVHKPVVRGKTYYLRMSISAQYQQTWNYFYDNTGPYNWGQMGTATLGLPQYDLAAHIMGSGRVLDQWGVNLFGYGLSTNELNNCGNRMAEMGVHREREQIILGQRDTPFVYWTPWIDTVGTIAYWGKMDTLMGGMADKGIEVILNLVGSTYKAACIDTNLGGPHHWLVDTSNPNWWGMWYPPKYLKKPVFAGGSVNPDNFWARFFYETVKRYGPIGTAPNGDTLGTFWRAHPGNDYPVKYWEIDNEVNGRITWKGNGDEYSWSCMDSVFPSRDYNKTGEDSSLFIGGAASRRTYWVKLYKLQCAKADSVIHWMYPNDPSIKILTNAVHAVNRKWATQLPDEMLGKEWLKAFYAEGGKPFSDGITYHAYQDVDLSTTPPESIHGFKPKYFQADFDTIRSIMKANGDTGLCWADEQGWGTTLQYFNKSPNFVSPSKQADCVLQMNTVGAALGASPYGPLGWVGLYQLRNYSDTDDTIWTNHAGVIQTDQTTGKPSYFAYKQANGKLKDKYFNRRVPIGTPPDSVFCYEFEDPGTRLKTFVMWRADTLTREDSIPIRTAQFGKVHIAYNGSLDSTGWDMTGTGRAKFSCDSVPRYLNEVGDTSRPDVVVDSFYTYPTSPKAGEAVYFYARLKNVGNAALSSNIVNSVTFQVDGASKKTYQKQQYLGIGDTVTLGYSPYPPPEDAPIYDWKATYGDHLIRAWADSADRFVELNETNNTAYLFKHMPPKVSVIINNNHKFTNHLTNDTLQVVMNGNTSPLPDSAKLLHEGSWTTLGVYGIRDTLVTFNNNGVKYDTVIVFQGADRDSSGDTIVVDASAPYTLITTPPDSQVVNGNSVEFAGFSYDFEYHDSLWELTENSEVWARGYSSVGNAWLWMPGTFGYWNADSAGGDWHTHILRSIDLALNAAYDTVHVQYVSPGDDGDGFGAGFGSFSSAPVNVATDAKGNVYVPETQGSMVRKFSPKKDTLFSFSARRGNDTTGLAWPAAIVCDPETVSGRATFYVADGYGHSVKRFNKQGNLLLRFGSFGTDTTQFKQPCGIALDWKDRLWVTDRLNHRIQVFDTTGHFLFQFGSQGSDSGKFNTPTGIAISKYKQVFISDTKNNQIQVFDSLGKWIKTIKYPDSLGFDTPTGICTDKHGNVFVADSKHNRIVELNPFGRRLFIFGTQGDSLCQFRNPIGVASSPSGHFLYVADLGNKRVQRFYVIRGDTLGGGGPQAGAGVRLPPKVNFLRQSQPNPTTGEARIEYGLAKESPVILKIYNVAGQVAREFNQGKQKAGYYSLTWDGRSSLGHKVGAGVYFYRLQAGSWVKTRKMIVIR